MNPPILASKLYRPRPRSNVVARSRLFDRMDAGQNRRVTLVSAPAGCGKTTLVNAWLDTGRRPVAWLSLDAGDGDPTRFLGCVIAALQTVAPGVGAGVASALGSLGNAPSESLLTVLLNEIADLADDVVLVLEDYHAIESGQVDPMLAYLVAHLPPPLHLVIVTREDPHLPLARLRASGQLTELRAADLRFDVAEATAFLTDSMGLDLKPDDVARLEARTEGWIAGLQLAALSMQGRDDAAGFVASFTGSHRFVLDYLVEEVLERQPAALQAFLLQTSILDRMCGPLCDAVVQDASIPGRETLEAIDQANLFIVPLDDERHWFRYHHLFADLLRQRLAQSLTPRTGGAGAAALHGRASRWFEANGLDADAFTHAVAAGDVERAERLVDGAGVPLYYRGVVTPVLEWLGSLPTAVLDAHPALWVAYATASLFGGLTTGVESKLQAADAALANRPGGAADHGTVGRIASLRATLAVMEHDVDAVITQANRALEHLGSHDRAARSAAGWALGHAQQIRGDRAAAARAFAAVTAQAPSAGDTMYRLAATLTTGQLQESDNLLQPAEETFGRALHLAGDPPHPMVAEAHLGLARIAYQRDDLDAAFRHGQACGALLPLMEKVATVASHHMFTARLCLARGDDAGALASLDEAARYVLRNGFEFQMPEIAAVQVRALLRRGDLAQAVELAEHHALPLERARVHLARGEVLPAMALLEERRAHVEAAGWLDERLQVVALQAVALHAQGHVARAIAALTDALASAEPGGLVRRFVDEGAPMARLLADASRAALPAFAAKVMAAFARDELRGTTRQRQGSLADPLNARELEVLRLIAEGLSNREIGDRLYRALDTVKGHGRKIFEKLEVRSRTEAVARARELGLL